MALQNPLLPASDPPAEAIPAPAADILTCADIQLPAENTRKMYASAWRSFQDWAHGRGNLSLPPPLTPAVPQGSDCPPTPPRLPED